MESSITLNRPIRLVTALLCLLLIAPIVVVVILSFGGDSLMRFPPASLSLKWYDRFFSDAAWRDAMWRSLAIACMSCILSTVVGFLGAYGLVRGSSRSKKLLLSVVLLPLIVPTIIASIALYFISAPLKLIGSPVWMAVAHAVVSLPIVVLILVSAMQNVDLNLERAAFGLGASQWTTFRRIVLPLMAPGLVSSALFSFLTSFDEVVLSLFLSGVKGETLPVRIWNSLRLNMDSTVAAVSSFLIFVTVVVLVAEAAVQGWKGRRRRDV